MTVLVDAPDVIGAGCGGGGCGDGGGCGGGGVGTAGAAIMGISPGTTTGGVVADFTNL